MVAVTGANGLLGNFILKKLISEKVPVVGLRRVSQSANSIFDREVEWREVDIINSLSLTEAFKNINTVIHTAAVVSFDPSAKERIFQTNVIGTQNVVNACLALGIPRLIFISSVAALGRKKGIVEINEESKWVDSNLNSDYAKSKYLAELEVYRGQEEGLSVSIINPSVILSTADPNKSSAQIFKYVYEERRFYSDGSLNYVDARDVAEIAYKLYEKKLDSEKLIANAGSINVKELLNKIAARLQKKEPSIKVNPKLLYLAAWLEEMRCKITRTDALISRQSVKMPAENFFYQNQKSMNKLNMVYRPLDETLDWCCEYYKKAFTTNK
jgi:dihydroflavonol-4-reductase